MSLQNLLRTQQAEAGSARVDRPYLQFPLSIAEYFFLNLSTFGAITMVQYPCLGLRMKYS
jgi:hypothetical protein